MSRFRFLVSLPVVVVTLLAVVQTARADEEKQRRIEAGREQFTRVREYAKMQVDDSHFTERFFNARSCAECHKLGGVGGAGPNESNVDLIHLPPELVGGGSPETLKILRREFWDRATPKPILPPGTRPTVYGFFDTPERFIPVGNDSARMLHRYSTMPGYDEWRLKLLQELNPQRFAPREPNGGDVEPVRSALWGPPVSSQRNGLVRPSSTIEERNTPPLFGLGRIAKIPQEDIEAIAAEQPPMFRGRSPRLASGGRGRFGWKSQSATLLAFNEGACGAELGLRTANVTPSERLTSQGRKADSSETTYARAPAVDMTGDDVEAMTVYIEALPQPRKIVRPGHESEFATGKYLFQKTGCAVCHVPDVGSVTGLYSDLLLHEVGSSGSISYYNTNGPTNPDFDIVRATEFRTPPLWGVADSGPYLHDGSAATLDIAIRRHLGQALQSRDAYVNQISKAERAALLEFLGSLRAPTDTDLQP